MPSEVKSANGNGTIRMYCHSLGDSFLITFHTESGPFRVLIDCGAILGTPEPGKKMQEVVDSIVEDTGGNIDLLVISHEHWDHCSAFDEKQADWSKVTFKKLWFAWTEDPHNPLANELLGLRRKAETALRMAVQRMSAGNERRESLTEFLGFSGDGVGKTKAAMDRAAAKVTDSGGAIEYRAPGEVVELIPGLIRVFVLGPPEDRKAITTSDPSKSNPEVYTLRGAEGPLQSLAAALQIHLGIDPTDDSQDLLQRPPFDASFCIEEDVAKSGQTTLPKAMGEALASYFNPQNDWRRIDDDWLSATTPLALNLDSDTNNTSLALAFEFIQTGDILLFPADAQVGNWMSWGDRQYTYTTADGKQVSVTIEDILKRTVFYKAGHHGSHNATMKARGLELMNSPKLHAMIPVDVDIAHNKKHWNQMPFLAMLKVLGEKCGGGARMIQLDQSVPSGSPFRAGPSSQTFAGNRQLYIELDVPPQFVKE